MKKLVDLSHIIEDGLVVYPGDIRTSLFQTRYMSVHHYNNHRMEIGMHSGTHIDGPMHFTESTEYIYELPLESFIGEGCLLDVRNEAVIQLKPEYEEKIKESSIVLLYTGMDKKLGSEEYFTDHPVVSPELAELLVRKKVKILGMDMISPDKMPFEVHTILLSNKTLIIENLTNLDKLVDMGSFEVMAFPLRIKADSSILRVIAREL